MDPHPHLAYPVSVKLIFWLCVAGVVWCYAGYPLSQLLRARLWPRCAGPGAPADGALVSLVLAVRDGAAHQQFRSDAAGVWTTALAALVPEQSASSLQ